MRPQMAEQLNAHGPEPGPIESDLVPHDLRFSALLGAPGWWRLPPAVRERFSKRLDAGASVTYAGEIVESRRTAVWRWPDTASGWLFKPKLDWRIAKMCSGSDLLVMVDDLFQSDRRRRSRRRFRKHRPRGCLRSTGPAQIKSLRFDAGPLHETHHESGRQDRRHIDNAGKADRDGRHGQGFVYRDHLRVPGPARKIVQGYTNCSPALLIYNPGWTAWRLQSAFRRAGTLSNP
jgi:hypothetical protein